MTGVAEVAEDDALERRMQEPAAERAERILRLVDPIERDTGGVGLAKRATWSGTASGTGSSGKERV